MLKLLIEYRAPPPDQLQSQHDPRDQASTQNTTKSAASGRANLDDVNAEGQSAVAIAGWFAHLCVMFVFCFCEASAEGLWSFVRSIRPPVLPPTPLRAPYLAHDDRPQNLAVLLAAKANPNIVDRHGFTALRVGPPSFVVH